MSAEEPDEADDSADEEEDIRYFVRIGQTDLDGTKSVERSLTDLNGIGRRAARIIAAEADVDRTDVFGGLEDDKIDEVVDAVENGAARPPTDEELREAGIDPEDNRQSGSGDLPDVLE